MGHIGPSLIPLVYGPKIPGFNFKDVGMFSNVLEMSNMSGKEAKINLLESLYKTNIFIFYQVQQYPPSPGFCSPAVFSPGFLSPAIFSSENRADPTIYSDDSQVEPLLETSYFTK